MTRVEIFRGQAQRRWSDEEKRRLVAETLVPGETVQAVAPAAWREHEPAVHLAQAVSRPARPPGARTWDAGVRRGRGVAPVSLSPEALGEAGSRPDAATPAGVIEIELSRGGWVRIFGSVDPAVVTAALRVLVRR